MTLAFSSSAATVSVASATVTSSAARFPFSPLVSPTLRGFVSFRLTAKKLPLRSHGGAVRATSELVQDKESVVAATTSFHDDEETSRSELKHSRTFLDARTEQDIISGIKKEREAGTLPPNVASGMEELYWNYKKAVLSSGASRADETVLSNMSLAFDRMFLGVEHPYTFNPYHKAIREPFDYFHFVHTYIRPLIDFENSYVGNVSIFSELEDKIRQGHNIVLISNHQSEADPAVISLLLEAQCPYIGENIKCVAGDRVITDPLCKPFSMGRNLICVYSKNHMNDDPELVDMKRKANTRSLKEMATLLRSVSQLIWIAPSGGRDRPNPSTGEWFPAPFDPSSVDNMRRLVEHSGIPGHIYPMSLLCCDIMPPPPKVEKEIGERRLVGFHGTGLSVAPEISFSDVTADCNNPNEAKEAYSQALYNSVNEQYKTLNSAIKQRRGIEASISTVSLSQPWNESQCLGYNQWNKSTEIYTPKVPLPGERKKHAPFGF